nr:hypothetical protein [Acinetobacter sp. YH12219]
MATYEFWSKNTGEDEDATEWHRITTNGRLAVLPVSTLKKVERFMYCYVSLNRPGASMCIAVPISLMGHNHKCS